MESGIDTSKIRQSAFAGSFYPQNNSELADSLKGYLNNVNICVDLPVKALIVPHAGYVYSGQTAAYGFRQLKQNKNIGNNFVLIGPSHNFGFSGIVGNDYQFWETPLGKIRHQKPLGNKQIRNELFIPEHSIEVELPFLQYLIADNLSVNCFLTGIDIDLFKETEYFQQYYPESIYIISSDLSHYLPKKPAEKIDDKTIKAILNGDIKYIATCDNVACGSAGISMVMNLAIRNNWKSRLVYYDSSATFSGDTKQVVGYAAIAYFK